MAIERQLITMAQKESRSRGYKAQGLLISSQERQLKKHRDKIVQIKRQYQATTSNSPTRSLKRVSGTRASLQ